MGKFQLLRIISYDLEFCICNKMISFLFCSLLFSAYGQSSYWSWTYISEIYIPNLVLENPDVVQVNYDYQTYEGRDIPQITLNFDSKCQNVRNFVFTICVYLANLS